MTKRPDKTLPAARFRSLMIEGERGEWRWTTPPRDYFASGPDHRRWEERFAGKPVDETQDAFRIRVIETPRGLRRWHLQFVVGIQGFSVSSYDDREEVEMEIDHYRRTGGRGRSRAIHRQHSVGEYGLLAGGRLPLGGKGLVSGQDSDGGRKRS